MALLSPKLHRFLLTKLHHSSSSSSSSSSSFSKTTKTNKLIIRRRSSRCCSAIAIDAPSSLTDDEGIRWGSATLQGLREEMEDAAVVRSDGIDGYLFAAVFDGHGGYSSVKFLRDELYKDCVAALQGGLLLKGGDFNLIKAALEKAFDDTDKRLLLLLETVAGEDESGATATVALIGNDVLFISHIGDSCVVLSRSGGSQVLTSSHRPYGNNSTSLQEVRRIREAGGWIVNGRICGDISVSRAFGDIRFKTKKNEMLQKGVEERRWSEKFVSRVRFNGDLVTASPDILQVALGSNVEFVLIASDGLWDYMSSSDAVTFVRNQLRQHGDVQLASEALAQAALEKGSQDNISIVVADLGRTDWQNLPLQKDNFIFELAQAFATIGIVTFGVWISSVFSL